MSTIASLTPTENGADSLIDINANFANLNTDKLEASDIVNKENIANKVTAFATPTNTQYPSAKLVYDQLATKQAVGTYGDVTGPASAVDGNFASFNLTTGKIIQDSGKKASDFATAAQGTTADNAVPKSTYDANTILYATTDNTPVALTVGTNTVVGRINGAITTLAVDSDLTSTSAGDDSVPSAKATKAMGDTKALLAGSTSQAFSVSQLELGAASDTTLTRVSAGVIAVEGVTIPTISSTSTLTAKRINPRLVTAASYTTDTGTSLDVSTCDQFEVTAQAGALKLNNPSGTPVGGQQLIVRITDNGTARALTYDTQFRASSDLPLPTTTIVNKTLYMKFVYNATATKWDLLAFLNNF